MTRYDEGRKAETHAKVVKAASERFRKNGIDGVGVATIMKDVGLTHGGFYAHFASKEALISEAVLHACNAWSDAQTDAEEKAFELQTFISGYLSAGHRDKPAIGCPLAAFGPELARRPKETRIAFSEELRSMVGKIASSLPDQMLSIEVRTTLANAIIAQLSDSLQLSRVVACKAESDAILAAGRGAALTLAGLGIEATAVR